VIVQSRNADGTLVLSPLFGGADIVVWHHADLRGTLSIGEPASLHGVYGVLAAGRARYNVATISIAAS
jgi:hypothetical protein